MTTPAPRIGVRVAQYGGDWSRLRDGALHAERLGFDSLWVNDHLRSPGRLAAEPTFDAMTTLAALAPLTSRVGLGTAVLSASYRHPAVAAKAVSLLDVISGGRMILGLGTGSHREEHSAYGIPFAAPGARTDGLRRALDVAAAMFATPDGATLDGELRDAPNQPAPVQRPRPPIWLAAHGPVLLRLAGRRADGVIAAFCPPDEFARRRAIAEQARAAAGRPAMEYALYTFALPVRSDREADAWLADDAAALGTEPSRMRRWLGTTGIVAPPDELRERIAEYGSVGATRIIVALPHRAPLDVLDVLAEATLDASATRRPRRQERGRRQDNLVHLLVDRHRIDGRGGDPALVDQDGTVDFDGLAHLAARAAGALAARGVRPGDRVGIALPDGRAWCAAFLGACGLGAVAVPLPADGEPDAVATALADCAARVVVADGERVLGAPVVDADELASGARTALSPVEPGDLAYLVYSSGSTGRPKAALHAHGDLRVGIETYAARVLGLRPGDRCHSAARLHTSLGFGNGFFRVLGSGATAVLHGGPPGPRTTLEVVALHGVTVLTGVPTFWAQLAAYGARRPSEVTALATIRAAVSSGDGLSTAVADAVRAALGIELIQGLGCSECSNIVISARPGERADGSLGTPVPGVEIELRDPDGTPVGDDAPGRLWIRSGSNTTGYWSRPELTRDLVHGEWLRMGDVLVRRNGRLHHLGRADAMFKVDGRWVSPPQVEDALLGNPGVLEAAVVGRRDGRGLVRTAAFLVVEADADVSDEELRARVGRVAGTHAVPRTIERRPELPRLSSGKLDRRALADLGAG